MTDSPGANYLNNTNSWSRTSAAINLSGMTNCRAQYYLWLNTEQGFDGIFVEASTNATTWTEIAGWSGVSGGWVWLDEDLSAFDGQPTVYLRYRLFTDGSQTRDGAYVDDVAVRCTPSVYTGNEYAYMQGSSMASPHVAGACGARLGQDAGRECGRGEGRRAAGGGPEGVAHRRGGIRWPAERQPHAATRERDRGAHTCGLWPQPGCRSRWYRPTHRALLRTGYTGLRLRAASCAPPVQRSTQLTVGRQLGLAL